MLLPAITGSGESVLVTDKSACVLTVVVAVAVLLAVFGSELVGAAVAELVMVAPLAVLGLTFTTMGNTAVSPLRTDAFEKTTLPVPPTAGELVDQPVPGVTTADTNVVFAGTASVTVTLVALPGPLFTKLTV